MGLLSLVFGTKNKLKIANIDVDVSLSEEHSSSCEITENPVENGANTTDHVQVKPDSLTIEGLVTDTPIKLLGNAFVGDNRARKTYDLLRQIKDAREPISVVTGLRQYENMVLTSLSVPRDPDTGRAIRFRAEFREIRIVDSETIAIESTASKFKGGKSLGKQTPAPATGKAADEGASVLARITGLGA